MAPDPCWLPSAIMQTTAALLGIYAVIYVLAVERIPYGRVVDKKFRLADSNQYGTTYGELLYLSFLFLIAMCSLTILFNSLWLDSLSTNIIIKQNLPYIGVIAYILFVLTVSYIATYSMAITTWLSSKH